MGKWGYNLGFIPKRPRTRTVLVRVYLPEVGAYRSMYVHRSYSGIILALNDPKVPGQYRRIPPRHVHPEDVWRIPACL